MVVSAQSYGSRSAITMAHAFPRKSYLRLPADDEQHQPMIQSGRDDFDVAVIGGGLVGAALAIGCALKKKRTVVFDEGDVATRAARANFGLVWIQGKGMGLPAYSNWTRRAGARWSELASMLLDLTGVDVKLEQRGGLLPVTSEINMSNAVSKLKALQEQPGFQKYNYEIMDRQAASRLVPDLGPEVVGAIFCPLDGHVNPLLLFRAMHLAFESLDITYHGDCPAEKIVAADGGYRIYSRNKPIASEKILIAAGLATTELAKQIGLNVPLSPQRGQIIVTEKISRFLDYPLNMIRQTDNGSILIGNSSDQVGLLDEVTAGTVASISQTALRIMPKLAELNVARIWAGLRVMSPDGFPIYEQSESHPGAFVAACHSGVTLAPVHALDVPQQVINGKLDIDMVAFSTGRFNVQVH